MRAVVHSMSAMHVILVFGCAVDEAGEPRPALTRRLGKALELARADTAAHLIVSGRGEAGPMRAWLVRHGLDAARISPEPAARTTLENVLLSLPMLRALGATKVTAVSERYHLRRCRVLTGAALRLADYELALAGVAAPHHLVGLERLLVPALERYKLAEDLLAMWRRGLAAEVVA